MTVLEVERLSVGYKGVPAVRDVGLALGAGEVFSIIGPNGAGKTSFLLALAGVLKPLAGTIRAFGRDLTGMPAHLVARHGVILVPDDRGVFAGLTVEEHLRLAGASRWSTKAENANGLDRDGVLGYFPALVPLARRRCGLLSGGEQQMLAIAKALLQQPRLLMVDELSLGLAPLLVQSILPSLRAVADRTGMSIIIVEQHFELALEVSDKAMVLNHGRVVLDGPARELLADRTRLEHGYLGADVNAESEVKEGGG